MTITAQDWHDLKREWKDLTSSVKVGVASVHKSNIFHTADHNEYSMATIIDNNHFELFYTEKKVENGKQLVSYVISERKKKFIDFYKWPIDL